MAACDWSVATESSKLIGPRNRIVDFSLAHVVRDASVLEDSRGYPVGTNKQGRITKCMHLFLTFFGYSEFLFNFRPFFCSFSLKFCSFLICFVYLPFSFVFDLQKNDLFTKTKEEHILF